MHGIYFGTGLANAKTMECVGMTVKYSIMLHVYPFLVSFFGKWLNLMCHEKMKLGNSQFSFLDARKRLYKRLRPSVGLSVGRSPYRFECIFLSRLLTD
jgi:hypothetical protein